MVSDERSVNPRENCLSFRLCACVFTHSAAQQTLDSTTMVWNTHCFHLPETLTNTHLLVAERDWHSHLGKLLSPKTKHTSALRPCILQERYLQKDSSQKAPMSPQQKETLRYSHVTNTKQKWKWVNYCYLNNRDESHTILGERSQTQEIYCMIPFIYTTQLVKRHWRSPGLGEDPWKRLLELMMFWFLFWVLIMWVCSACGSSHLWFVLYMFLLSKK